jgi:uncharacterized membrane protein YkvA (DUF1232 family)
MIRLLRLWRMCARDLRLLWFALRHPHRPVWLLPAVLILGLYALEPFNFVMPIVGMVDDFIVLPLLLHLLVSFLPLDVRAAFGLRKISAR